MIASKCPDIYVVVVDLSKPRIDAWNTDDLPIFEPGLLEFVKSCRGRCVQRCAWPASAPSCLIETATPPSLAGTSSSPRTWRRKSRQQTSSLCR